MRKYLKPKASYRMKIGQNIRAWRNLKGIKQDELAKMLGITSPALSQIENDITELTLKRIEDIADVMELKPEQLLENPHETIYTAKPTIMKGNEASNSNNNSSDKDLLERVITLMENMQNYISGKNVF